MGENNKDKKKNKYVEFNYEDYFNSIHGVKEVEPPIKDIYNKGILTENKKNNIEAAQIEIGGDSSKEDEETNIQASTIPDVSGELKKLQAGEKPGAELDQEPRETITEDVPELKEVLLVKDTNKTPELEKEEINIQTTEKSIDYSLVKLDNLKIWVVSIFFLILLNTVVNFCIFAMLLV